MLRFLKQQSWPLAVLAFLCAVAVVCAGRWANAIKVGGQAFAEPYRIAGNLYFVGASDLSSFPIAGPDGHILIDGGYPTTAGLILKSIADLGFDIRDVKVLLNSAPTFEEGGGLGVIQDASGAAVWANDWGARVLESGGDDPELLRA